MKRFCQAAFSDKYSFVSKQIVRFLLYDIFDFGFPARSKRAIRIAKSSGRGSKENVSATNGPFIRIRGVNIRGEESVIHKKRL